MIAVHRQRTARFLPAVEPNVIPFIDVLLVLLIIFMVTAPKPTVDLRLELASRSGIPPIIAPTIIDIEQAPGGAVRMLVDQQEVAASDLAQRTLANVLSHNGALTPEDVYADARIYVRADQDIAYGNVVAALDILQSARFAKVGIFAQRVDES